jgi:hypothetical protein
MKNFWVGFKAFISSPLKFISDPANTTIAYQVKLMEAEGRSMAEIDQALSENDMVKGGGITPIFKGLVDGMDFVFKNLPAILLIVVVLVVGWYVLMFRKAAA